MPMGLNEALEQTKVLVNIQQSAVRAENSGFAAGSGRAAAATDRTTRALDMHIKSMPAEQLRAVIIHLVRDLEAANAK